MGVAAAGWAQTGSGGVGCGARVQGFIQGSAGCHTAGAAVLWTEGE